MTIEDLVNEVRAQRISEITTPGTHDRPLMGECPRNAVATAEVLYEAGYTVWIACGSFDTGSGFPPSFESARDLGQNHHWAVALIDGVPTHIDICPEDVHAPVPTISSQLPSAHRAYFYLPYTSSNHVSTTDLRTKSRDEFSTVTTEL